MPLPDDPDDESGFVPPVHPDDRLWRHPSEMAAAQRAGAGAGGGSGGPTPPPLIGDQGPDGAGSRVWGVAAASVFVGVAATLAVLAFAGAFDRPVRTVIEQVDAGPTTEPDAGEVAGAVGPALVQVVATRPDGTTESTGVMVRADGHLLTTADSVAAADSVTVTTADGSVLPATVVGLDHDSDLAVLDVDAVDMPVAPVGDVSSLTAGDEAVAVARASGSTGPTVATGRVSALGLHVDAADGSDLYDMIETALQLDPSSGAVLCSLDGAILGLLTDRAAVDVPHYTATSLASDDDGAADPGATVTTLAASGPTVTRYATPIDYANQVAGDLIDAGVVRHAWLGVLVEDLAPAEAAELGRSGARLTTVRPGGPAAQVGMAVGDVVVALDDATVTSMADLVVALRTHRRGDEVTVRYVRDGRPHSAEVTLTGDG